MLAEELPLLAQLIRGQRQAALATTHNGMPAVSMVAYAPEPGFAGMLLHLSRLAAHTADLLAAPEAALLLAWRDGADLAGGLAAALACDEAFDFSTALPRLIGDEVIAAIG